MYLSDWAKYNEICCWDMECSKNSPLNDRNKRDYDAKIENV